MVDLDRIKSCSFSDLTPSFHCGDMLGYDARSFNKFDEVITVPEAPEQPSIIKAELFAIMERGELKDIKREVHVLIFHGFSTKEFWRQKFPPHEDIEQIIARINPLIDLEFIAVCNPGGYILPAESKYSQNYFGSMGQVSIIRADNLAVTVQGEKIFRKGKQYT